MNSFKQIWKENKFKKNVRGIIFEIKDNCLYIDDTVIPFNTYDILEIIDAGANAIILKGKEKISNRICAIKVWFSKDKRTGELNIEKHKKEIEKIANFDSNLIVKYYSTDIISNHAYCSMEYVNGQTLKSYLESRHPSLHTRYKIMNDIIKALRIAHSKDIYHGDLHDRNILINNCGEIKVLDFGTSLGKKEYSMSRDSQLMYKLGKTVMGNHNYKKLIWMNKHNPKSLSPKTMRLILESMSKVIVLLDFLKYGVVENLINDLAFFTTLVPFYNLKYIANEIYKNSNENKRDENLKFFFDRLDYEITKRMEVYGLTDSFELKSDNIKPLYVKINECFIENTTKYLEEKYIYYDEREVELFKSNLYSDFIIKNDSDTNLDIIDKALSKFN